MYNWSTDTTRLKQNSNAWEIWKLEQKINYGLGNSKLSKKKLRKYWGQLKIDPDKKQYLKILLDL